MQKNNITFLKLRNNLNYLQQIPHVKNLPSTRTIYHNYIPSYAKDIKVKNYSDYRIYLFIIIFSSLFKLIKVFPPIIVVLLISPILIVLSIILIIRGFKRYTIYNILVNTPVSKIHIATYGLNKVKGRFIPYGSQPLKTPISGQDCIYYSISAWYTYLKSDGRNSYWVLNFLDGFDVGIPALFTDGTGFLAVDLEKAPIVEVRTNIIEIIPNSSQDNKIKSPNFNDAKRISDEILPYIRYAANNNAQANLSYIKNYEFIIGNSITTNLKENVSFDELRNSIFSNKSGVKIHLWKYEHQNHLYLIEQYIPINEDYTIIGGFADTGEMINMKPVKVTVPDMSTGILWLSIKKIFGREFIAWAALDILFGIGFLILAILFLTKFSL